MKKIILFAVFSVVCFAVNAQLNNQESPKLRLAKPLDSSFFNSPQFDYRDLKNKDIIARLTPKKNDIPVIKPNLSGTVPMPNAYNKERDDSVKIPNAFKGKVKME